MIKLVMSVKYPASWILMFPQTVCLRLIAHDLSCLWLLEAQTSLPPKLHNSLLCELIALTPSSCDCCFHVLRKNTADLLIYCSMMGIRLTM